MNLIDLFVSRRRATIAFIMLIIITGIGCYRSISKESTPDVKIPFIYVMVAYPGISPEDAERMMARPLENELKSIDGLKAITSYGYEGSAVVLLEFTAGFDSDKALTKVRDKVQDVKDNLPIDAREPRVMEVNLSLFPVLNIILSSDIDQRALLKIARDLRTRLEGLPGVLKIDILGNKTEIVEIVVSPENIEQYSLNPALIAEALNANNKLLTTGTARSQGGEFSVKMPSLVKDYSMLLDFPIKANNHTVLKLGDIANVRLAFKENNSIARANGKSAIIVQVVKKTGANVIKTIDIVKSAIEKERQFWPQNIDIDYAQDESHDIKEMLLDLENNIIIGAILVLIVVIMSVGARSAILIALSIPISFFAGILFINFLNMSLNVVVLFSLILTAGMIVDDAIVVSEYADRLLAKGQEVQSAFIESAKRMLWPVITSTLVKIVVFMPLLFWPGVIGQFMKYMPITVIAILGSSLIFALLFQPALGPLFGYSKADNMHNMASIDEGDLSKLDGWSEKYYKVLSRVLLHPKLFVSGVTASLFVVIFIFALVGPGLEFFPKIEPKSASITIQSPGNLGLKDKIDIMMRLEEILQKHENELAAFYLQIKDFKTNTQLPKNTIVAAMVEFANWQKRRPANVILHEIELEMNKIAGIKFEFIEAKDGPPPQKPIQIDVTGRSFEAIEKKATELKAMMNNDNDLTDITDSLDFGSLEMQIIPDRVEAARFGLTVQEIGNFISIATEGLKLSTYRSDDLDEETDIVLRFAESDRGVVNIDKLNIVNSMGHVIPISNVVKQKFAKAVSTVKKADKDFVISIQSNVKNGVNTDQKVRKLKAWAVSNKDNMTNILFKGEDNDMQETVGFLQNAFLLTLFMMFMIMLIQFNNVYHTCVIMSAVFLSTTGVLLGLLITYQPFGVVMCGIAIIALGGIVLNNNILFIDTYQHLRRQNIDQDHAIVLSGVQRIRPIVLTAATAILGLLPMVFGVTINVIDREITIGSPASQWWRQLSASIAGGLMFSTILTLLFTPCLLKLGKRFDNS